MCAMAKSAKPTFEMCLTDLRRASCDSDEEWPPQTCRPSSVLSRGAAGGAARTPSSSAPRG